MRFRVTNWRHVLAYSGLITALAVAVPVVIVAVALGRVPMMFKLPILVISGLIPFFITLPISIFAMHMFKLINQTVATLDNLVKFDTLTGLLSRVRFLQMVEEYRSKGGYLAILDADHFKKINDNYGHEAGDIALKHIASLVTQSVGSHGFVGRMGGEEFAIYLPSSAREQAKLVLANVGSVLRSQPSVYRGLEISVTVSAGLVFHERLESVASAMRRADSCLYKAKHSGRDQYVLEEGLDEQVVSAA
jgi:diguanylate cyclase